jgi:hypothetical protein
MADWITIPSFTTGQVVRAETFQDIWTNLYTLKRPVSAVQEMPGPTLADWNTVTTGAFLDIDATYWQITFESSGGDVFISADFITDHSVANGTSYWRFMLDGVGLGNDLGLAGNRDNTQREVLNMHTLVEGLAAGSHTLSAQYYNVTAGTLEVEKEACMTFWTYEFP